MFGKVKILKFLEGFELMTNRCLVNPLAQCATRFGDKIHKFLLIFIVYFDQSSTH